MTTLRFFFVFLLSGLLGLTTLSAEGFEGVIEMKVKQGQKSHTMNYATKGGQMHISTSAGPMGEASAIVDLAAGKIYALMPSQKMYVEVPVSKTVQAAASHFGTPKENPLRLTDETMEIMGYPCRKYIYREEKGPVHIWATDQLGSFVAMPENPMQGDTKKKRWSDYVEGDFFPMKMAAFNKAGNELASWEVTKVSPQEISPEQFTIPAGFKKIEVDDVMQGIQGMKEGLGGLKGLMGGKK